jgi:hypothetical protein
MKPLTLDDLIPLDEYINRRREFVESHHRYVDRYRRIRIGPRLTLHFENRQTLWFRVQEIIRVARLADAAELQQELDLHNGLLPTRDLLQAALLIDIGDQPDLAQATAWRNLEGQHLGLYLGDRRVPAALVTSRPQDRCIGAAHWLHFPIDNTSRRRLTDPKVTAFFECDTGLYHHRSANLSEPFRQSLLEDLQLSDRDAA